VCTLGLTPDFVKVLDFGLVRNVERSGSDDVHATTVGAAIGTPATMAPEQIAGGADFDHRIDLYALGCVACWLVTGQQAFDEPTTAAMIHAHLRHAPTAPSARVSQALPAGFDDIVLRCLEKAPGDRFQTAREVRDALMALDVEPWTEADAEAWWRQNGERLRTDIVIHEDTEDPSRTSRLIRRRL
jgi:serine/threonine-protein kinase